MRKQIVGMMLVAAALAACGGDAAQSGEGAVSSKSEDSGPEPTPALDSVGGAREDQGRQD